MINVPFGGPRLASRGYVLSAPNPAERQCLFGASISGCSLCSEERPCFVWETIFIFFVQLRFVVSLVVGLVS